MSTQLTFIILFVAVLAVIGLATWLFRRFASNRLGSNTNRGRMPRLAVIDAAAVDARRRLVLVRRDNIEHLLMIGGPSDIVIEQNIVRATPQRDSAMPRGPVGAELPPRAAPLPDAGHWNDSGPEQADYHEPAPPEMPTRPARPPFADEIRRPPPAAAAERRAIELTGRAGTGADGAPRAPAGLPYRAPAFTIAPPSTRRTPRSAQQRTDDAPGIVTAP